LAYCKTYWDKLEFPDCKIVFALRKTLRWETVSRAHTYVTLTNVKLHAGLLDEKQGG